MDVWVDKSGYLRRERMTFEEQGAKATMTMTMTDFGRAVSIKPPPKGETVDMTKVAASGGG